MIERLTLQDDGPDGMTLFLEGDFEFVHGYSHDGQHFPISRDALYAFLYSREVQAVLEHIAEGERERALYDAATPEERAVVLGGENPLLDEVLDEMYGDDPEALREQADFIRDREREK